MAEREKEADIDPLTPYLARMFGANFQHFKDPLSLREATLVREQCINDFKARQLARQALVQERFDKVRYERVHFFIHDRQKTPSDVKRKVKSNREGNLADLD